MKKRNVFCQLVVWSLLLLLIQTNKASAENVNLDSINQENHVLVIYDSIKGELDEEERMLDMTLGHFAEDIHFVSSEKVVEADTEGITHLVYFGQVEEQLPQEVVEVVGNFKGPKLGIGYNVDQFGGAFAFVDLGEEQVINKLIYINDESKTKEIETQNIIEAMVDSETETIVSGKGETGEFPFIVRNQGTYYMASDSLFPPNAIYLAKVLNQLFEVKEAVATPAYIRLEDVHPLSDPENLMAIAKELKERNIPYMVATIPVYTDPETGIEYHFEDFPKVLKALKYMQKNGGSIVLHGYTHQYRGSETGEGFEFWDVENQSPIYSKPNATVKKIGPLDFNNQEDYLAAVAAEKEFEADYIKTRLTKGVQELANYGLYPLAFEAPHYTMSQNGYEVTSELFSTYVGQIQLSDEEWQIMNTVPYASKPSFMKGMLVLPETIGYVDPNSKNPIADMMEAVDLYQVADNGILGGFYHPYLGVDGFNTLMDEMEKTPNIQWINLKELDNSVQVENVSITSKKGEVTAKVNHLGLMGTSLRYPEYQLRVGLDKIIWAMVYLGMVTISLLIIFITIQKRKERQFGGE